MGRRQGLGRSARGKKKQIPRRGGFGMTVLHRGQNTPLRKKFFESMTALSPIREAVPFTVDHARLAGDIAAHTRPLGLSFGDRACLALGVALKVPVYTADKSWKKVKTRARVHVIGEGSLRLTRR